MNMDLMIRVVTKSQESGKYYCIDDLLGQIKIAHSKDSKYESWGRLKKESLRRRISYLERNHLALFNNKHICYICGSRRKKILQLTPISYGYSNIILKSELDDYEKDELLNIIGRSQEYASLILFVKYMTTNKTTFMKTGRNEADMVGMPYEMYLQYLNLLSRHHFFERKEIGKALVYSINDQLKPLLQGGI